LVEEEEGSEAIIWPKVAAAKIVGAGRNHRAMAQAIRVWQRELGRVRGELR
jgi:hypothetical protein